MSNPVSKIEDLKKDLNATELEERLEMVQLAAAADKKACINGVCETK
jgi:putative component of toxin-antitoxin plasmid stabilization module